MRSCSWLLTLVLVASSSVSLPVKRSDDSWSSVSSLSPNDVDFRMEGTKKLGRVQLSEGEVSREEEEEEEEFDSQLVREKLGDESGELEALRVQSSGSKDDPATRSSKKGRKHKAFFLDFPFVPQVRRYQSPTTSWADANLRNHNNYSGEKKKLGHRKRHQQQQQESQIFYIRLPPTPYSFVPGLGYISQPPTFSTAPLQRPPQRPLRPSIVHHKPTNKPFINVPIDFVSNGKPTGVYQWNGSKRPESPLNSLSEGPYVFNGRPTSLYLLTPDGQKTGHQPIRLADYSGKRFY